MEPFPKVNRSIDTKRGTYVQTKLYLITFLNNFSLRSMKVDQVESFQMETFTEPPTGHLDSCGFICPELFAERSIPVYSYILVFLYISIYLPPHILLCAERTISMKQFKVSSSLWFIVLPDSVIFYRPLFSTVYSNPID